MIPWKVLASVVTSEGELQLRQRGPGEFLITIANRVLMTSTNRISEEAVATLACKEIAARNGPRVLIGGLGMAYTLRAALDALSASAAVTVVELTREVETWCRGPLASLTRGAVLDPRVRVVIGDVSRVIRDASPGSYDAIVLDLYEGPSAEDERHNDPFYARDALLRSHAALSPGGTLAVWSEDLNDSFTRRMTNAGFTTSVHHPGGSRSFVVYLGRRAASLEAKPPAPRAAPRPPRPRSR